MLNSIQKKISKESILKLTFLLFFVLLIFDRVLTLIYFGFIYTDIDQLILWNGALDYSNGIFHEPFFYGQPYNYMLEAFLAAPLLLFDVPVYKALPIITSIIAILPYVILALLLFKKQKYFWSYLCLLVPVVLPIEYNFLTTISRGFVQAQFFIPFLFIPLLNPENRKNVNLLFIFASLCFIANQSAILIIFPISIYVASYHFKSKSFYLKALWSIPFLLLDYIFKYYYKIHPEKVLHDISGLNLDRQTFLNSLTNTNLFEYLTPFTNGGIYIYLLLFLLLATIAFKKAMKKEFLFILSTVFIILISLAIPKVQSAYPIDNAGIFFSVSRFYLSLPILVILSVYLVVKDYKIKKFPSFLLLALCLIAFFFKNFDIQKKVIETTQNTSFPISKNQDLVDRSNKLKKLITKYQVDLIISKMLPEWEWNNLYDSYALNPLINKKTKKEVISVNLNGDRRSWLYEDSKYSSRILLVGFEIDEEIIKSFDYEIVDSKYILIKNNKLSSKILFEKMNLKIGNFTHI